MNTANKVAIENTGAVDELGITKLTTVDLSKHKHVEDEALLSLTATAALNEKSAMLVLLEYLLEVDMRRLYCTKSYSTLFEYTVKELGYSEPAAAERVNAVRLMRAVPEVKVHLENGKLSLTTAAQIHRFIKTEEKVKRNSAGKDKGEPEKANQDKLDKSKIAKELIINACLDHSKREVEKILLSKQSEPAKIITQEKVKQISEKRTELRFTVDEVALQNLEAVKALIGSQSLENIFNQALQSLLAIEKKKKGADGVKITNPTLPAEFGKVKIENIKATTSEKNQMQSPQKPLATSRFIPINLKRFIFERSKGQCEHIDKATQKRCSSRYRLQIDHIHPLALGGKTEQQNLRHLCANHNLRAAVEMGINYKKAV